MTAKEIALKLKPLAEKAVEPFKTYVHVSEASADERKTVAPEEVLTLIQATEEMAEALQNALHRMDVLMGDTDSPDPDDEDTKVSAAGWQTLEKHGYGAP